MSNISLELDQLKNGNNLVYRSPRALIEINGRDARDFLQRMSTNNLKDLAKNNPLQTTFTNSKGGVIDHCLIFETGERSLLMVSSHTDAKILIDWLSTFHFIEDIEFLDKTHSFLTYIVLTTAKTYGDTSYYKYWQADIDCVTLRFYFGFCEPKYVTLLSDPSFETLRIAAGLPASPQEINGLVMPKTSIWIALLPIIRAATLAKKLSLRRARIKNA